MQYRINSAGLSCTNPAYLKETFGPYLTSGRYFNVFGISFLLRVYLSTWIPKLPFIDYSNSAIDNGGLGPHGINLTPVGLATFLECPHTLFWGKLSTAHMITLGRGQMKVCSVSPIPCPTWFFPTDFNLNHSSQISYNQKLFWILWVDLAVQSCPTLVTPWTTACQASLSFTVSLSLLKFMSIESVLVIQANHWTWFGTPKRVLDISERRWPFADMMQLWTMDSLHKGQLNTITVPTRGSVTAHKVTKRNVWKQNTVALELLD